MMNNIKIRPKHIITLLLCAWAIGIGARMFYEYSFGAAVCYRANLFDLFFDWLGLVFLGLAAMFYVILEVAWRQY